MFAPKADGDIPIAGGAPGRSVDSGHSGGSPGCPF